MNSIGKSPSPPVDRAVRNPPGQQSAPEIRLLAWKRRADFTRAGVEGDAPISGIAARVPATVAELTAEGTGTRLQMRAQKTPKPTNKERPTMTAASSRQQIDDLDVFVGVWRMKASLASEAGTPPRAETSFEWLEGRRFLVQRWRVEHPDAPDGIAIIGFDDERATYLQHYFDSRGVARVYEMSFADGVWKLWRIAPGFSQRFTGTFSETADTISGRWERSSDGLTWEHDFDLTYTRASQ